ncbi:hypothetical protein LZF95_25055 [Algoriphagus sp. AGSA1]|uniref:hypothetical protein n=1 Tax=Algoriphagus sp. AGSA1 TaxID=2907213 RepID=UPI001F44C45E|nr:hypothetical protein [Algoriphagus sp. AGSA1]MCE7057978.1 hypothetical protein [Algoriphagus sp. AGSA1]
MKKIFTYFLAVFCISQVAAQTTEKEAENKAVPHSSAFKLVDVSPTLIETPTTPKAFGLGILQSFDQSGGWPQNYSAEFTPYWWALPKNRDVYKFIGIRRTEDPVTKSEMYRSSPFSALKMTNISIAFLQKDLVPDSVDSAQKIFSAGLRTTIIRVYTGAYNEKLSTIINEIRNFQATRMAERIDDPDIIAAQLSGDKEKLAQAITRYSEKTREEVEKMVLRIQNHITQKPVYQWDLAAAYASYGIADTTWKTGRAAIWTTQSVNLLLNAQGESSKQNYLTISGYSRYMRDNFALKEGGIVRSNSFDIGGKLTLELDPISLGIEAIHRNYELEGDLLSQRVIGFLNYRIAKDIYLSGAFGNDFGLDKTKIMALFGLNWGFGSEKLTFSD